ncbi:uncharacterized protein EAE97_003928 [Botrytis byssoidea]|uniref:Uncharacterized protein n=1 Tax=Botrytis byssoidea TaxID=139641 RepID=A0A9P5INY4_9HELO|nr:uncharacterized protein EAE97_003928 [Botrytis byssoidea]KAF7948517.1 hypothetical protein EAE97_003928 [Botrytis byssoidea]
MEMFEVEAASIASTLPILPTPPIPSDSPTPQIIPILQTPPTPPIPEISPVTSIPQILSTSSMPPISSTELDTDHSSEFESESRKAMLKQERTPLVNISERKEAHADDLYSDDLYSDGVKWTTPKMPIPKSLPMSSRVLQMNYALCRLTDPPLPIRISDALHPFLLFYDVQRSCALSLENLLGFYGILLYQLLWGDKKHGRVTFSQHPAYFDIEHPDTSSSFIDAPNFDVGRTSPLSLNRKLAFILLLQVAKQTPSLRVIKKCPEAVPDWHRIDHLLCLGYKEYSWAIYSPADANVCMSYALKTWSRVQHHDPRLFSQECFESMKLSSNFGEVKRSDQYRERRAGSSFLLHSSGRPSKEIENRKPSDIKLYSNLTKSPFDNHVKLNGIYSSVQKLLGKYEILPNATRRMVWTCKCGHASYDDFTEFPGREGAAVDFAKELMKTGYITRAQITSQSLGTKLRVSGRFQNGINLISRKLLKIRNTSLSTFVKASLPKTPVCLPADGCRWLHLCMKEKPYATHLKPLHVCKDENQDPLTDKTFFRALKHAYSKERTWRDWAILKLRRIEFIGFEACPGDYVDHIKPNDLPPSTNEYDFAPPPPPKMVPPTGPEHMLHLFQDCPSISDVNSNFYLQRIPRRKIEPIAFNANKLSENLGWGLHFVEGLNTSLAITVMFILSSVLGIAFAICWTILEKDIQGAFGVAAYITSVVTLAIRKRQRANQ